MAIDGDGLKNPSISELKNIKVARKSIHIKTKVEKGDIINENVLISLRPGDGISPMLIPEIIGKKFRNDLKPFSKLKFEDFE